MFKMGDKDKKNIIIYGLGHCFYDDYFYKRILPTIEKKYNIIGVTDKKVPCNTTELLYPFIERSEELKKADYIIVTSDKYYSEIKLELYEDFGINDVLSAVQIENDIFNELFPIDLVKNKTGVEIGGPSRIFNPLYGIVEKCDGVNYSQNTVWWQGNCEKYCYNNKNLGEIIIADAINMEIIKDNQYDFCISSNNLEHIANPIKAILEFKRITKQGGIIVVVVPRKEECFDHNRAVTRFDHLVEDYQTNVDEHDLSHLDEIMKLHDFDMDPGVSSSEEFFNRAQSNYKNRCLHHHVFDLMTLEKLFEFVGLSIIKSGVLFLDYMIIGKVE